MGFLALISLLDIPFSVNLFPLLFRAHPVSDGFICIGARNHRKFLDGLSTKLGTQWQRRFFFVMVPEDFLLLRHWVDPIDGASSVPDATDEMTGYIRRLHNVPYE